MSGNLATWKERRALLADFQTNLLKRFGEDDYNVFVFGSYIREDFTPGESDIDLVVYCDNIIKRIDIVDFCREYFYHHNLPCDVLEYYYYEYEYVYATGILNSLPLTDYFPKKLRDELYIIAKNYAVHKKENVLRQKYQHWEYVIYKNKSAIKKEVPINGKVTS